MKTKKQIEREQWLRERQKGIGSSDAPAVIGHPEAFKTAAHVALEKQGIETDSTKKESDLMELGLMMEPVICHLYHKIKGLKPRRIHQIIRSRQFPWMHCSLDARVKGHALELKNVSAAFGRWGEDGTDDIPEPYIIQGQHDLAVLDEEYIEFPVLMWGRLRVYRVDRNEQIIAFLIEREKEFWEKHVVNQEPVPLDFNHPATLSLLKKQYCRIEPKSVVLTQEQIIAMNRYERLGKMISKLKKLQDSKHALILDALGDAQFGFLSVDRVVERKEVNRGAYDVKATTYIKISTHDIEQQQSK